MLTINVRQAAESAILDLKGTLLIPDDDEALLDVVSGCVSQGARLVVLDIARLVRVDAGGLGALVRLRNLLVSLDGELRLVNPTGFVGDVLRLTRLDSLIPTDTVANRTSTGDPSFRVAAMRDARPPRSLSNAVRNA